jgi:hypothetical protein
VKLLAPIAGLGFLVHPATAKIPSTANPAINKACLIFGVICCAPPHTLM